MRGTVTLPAPLALLVAVVALSACGSDDIGGRIPAADAAGLRASLSQVRDDVEAGECDSASSGAQSFVDGVNQLPAEATTELKDALRKAGERLQELVSAECAPTETTPERTTSTQTTTSSTTTTSETTTTTDTETDTTTSEPEPPPEEPGPGNGNGNGGGQGGAPSGGANGGSGGNTGGTGSTRG